MLYALLFVMLLYLLAPFIGYLILIAIVLMSKLWWFFAILLVVILCANAKGGK